MPNIGSQWRQRSRFETDAPLDFDANFYPIEAIKLMRQRWQETKAIPRRAPMISARMKAAQTSKRSAAARKA
jgi:hypothetical protein